MCRFLLQSSSRHLCNHLLLAFSYSGEASAGMEQRPAPTADRCETPAQVYTGKGIDLKQLQSEPHSGNV